MFGKYEFKLGRRKVHFLTCTDLGFLTGGNENQHSAARVVAAEICKYVQFHPDSAWKRSSKTCMKLTSAECTVENS
jgi:hypothetical protein